MNKFYEENKRNFSHSCIEDREKLVEIKKSILETYKIDNDFISDSYLVEYIELIIFLKKI